MTEFCEHFREIEPVAPASGGCEDCLAIGATWTELRVCLVCGHVGCCEDSEHAHALQHFNTTGHPVIAPLSRRETWGWAAVAATTTRCRQPLQAALAAAALFGR
jgi:hypothetical protein